MEAREAVRLTYGLVQIAFPGRAESLLTDVRPTRRARAVFRVLGTRDAVQAIVTSGPSRRRHTLGAAVDLVHALTAFIFASRHQRWRTSAIASATISVLFAAAELWTARHSLSSSRSSR